MIVGTAGHIDHGKSALVRALTGVDTDRLKEEKARGISIDLGFAYMADGDRTPIGFVDVPGHEKFVRNMLAGATGIDFVLLVVAADDGVMPQTREHLAIVDLLGASRGLVVLTKVDLVPPGRRREVADQIRAVLAPTGLADVLLIEASGATGEGIEAVRAALVAAARAMAARPADGRFRLAVDRCFSIPGAGTIVTGAVLSGSVSVGDGVVVSPGGLLARIRSIHAQDRPVRTGRAGERCALNLAGEGVHRQAIARGDVVLDPALHRPAARIDATLRLLASEARPLAHWTPVHLHHAAAEVAARVATIGEATIAPGAEGLIQLVLDRPIAAAVGDRFVLRDTSASRTIGGGRFVDLRAPHRRRSAPLRRAQLDALAQGDAAEALAAALDRWPFFVDLLLFSHDRALGEGQVEVLLRAVTHRRLSAGKDGWLVSPATWAALAGSARDALATFHRDQPHLLGLAPARLAAAFSPRLPHDVGRSAVRALVAAGAAAAEGGVVRLPEHRLDLDGGDRRLWARIAPLLAGDARFRPPRAGEIAVSLDARPFDVRRVLKAMARRREVAEIAPDHFFLADAVAEMAAIAIDVAGPEATGAFTVAEFRDRLGNGRKIAIQLLEYFDWHGLTLRRGDLRRTDPSRLDRFVTSAGAAGRLACGGESFPVERPDFKSG